MVASLDYTQRGGFIQAGFNEKMLTGRFDRATKNLPCVTPTCPVSLEEPADRDDHRNASLGSLSVSLFGFPDATKSFDAKHSVSGWNEHARNAMYNSPLSINFVISNLLFSPFPPFFFSRGKKKIRNSLSICEGKSIDSRKLVRLLILFLSSFIVYVYSQNISFYL